MNRSSVFQLMLLLGGAYLLWRAWIASERARAAASAGVSSVPAQERGSAVERSLNGVLREFLTGWGEGSVPGSEMEAVTPRFAGEFAKQPVEFNFDDYRSTAPASGWSLHAISFPEMGAADLALYFPDAWRSLPGVGTSARVVDDAGVERLLCSVMPVHAWLATDDTLLRCKVEAFVFHPLRLENAVTRWLVMTTQTSGWPYQLTGVYAVGGVALVVKAEASDVVSLERGIMVLINSSPWVC